MNPPVAPRANAFPPTFAGRRSRPAQELPFRLDAEKIQVELEAASFLFGV
jgi:hypothetical protein